MKFLSLIFIFLLLVPTVFGKEKPSNIENLICKKIKTKHGSYYDCFTSLKREIRVYGTEYSPGDYGRIFLQLLDEGQPVNNALCLIDLYYPDLTVWFDDASMFYLNGSDGLYYFDVVVPDNLGVYMTTVKCFYIIDETLDYADDTTVIKGLESGSFQDTWKDDNVYHTVKEKLYSGGYSLDFHYSFYDVQIPSNYTGMTIYWIGRWTSSEEVVYMYLWNWCNDSWVVLPNEISTNTPMVSNYLDSDGWNVNCFVAPNGTIMVRFSDSNASEKVEATELMTDFIDVQMHYATFGSIENIRGGGEIHVGLAGVTNLEDLKGLLFALHSTPESNRTCIDNNTLLIQKEIVWKVNNKIYRITKNETVYCRWGCNFDKVECNPSPLYQYGTLIGIIIFFVIIGFLAFYLK